VENFASPVPKDFARSIMRMQDWKYKVMPGGEGVETTTSILIHFDRGDEN